MAQMRTDELRELLERYPDLQRTDLRRLRQLYHDASATDLIAIRSNGEFTSKVDRLDGPSDVAWDLAVAAAAVIVACAIVIYLLAKG